MNYIHRPNVTTQTALIALLAAAALWPGQASARDLNQRVAIGAFRGPKAWALQDAVESALLRRYSLVPQSMVNEAARQSGVRLRSSDDFAEVARTLNVRAFVSATVTKDRDWRVEMVVRKGDTGEIVAHYDWSDSRMDVLAASMARATPKRLRALLSAEIQTPLPNPGEEMLVKASTGEDAIVAKPRRLQALASKTLAVREPDAEVRAKPVRGEAKDEDDDEVVKSDDGEDGDGTHAEQVRPYLELAVGGRVFSRSMSFADNINNLPGYRLDRAAAIVMDLAFHPFALGDSTRNSWAAGLGMTANVKYALGVGTQVSGADGQARGEVHGYEFGARYRAAIGIADLVPHVDYVVDTFKANVEGMSPDVGYRVVRTGVGTRLAITPQISLRLAGDYLHVLSAGPLTGPDRFPRATANGVDLSVGAGYALGGALEAQFTVGMRRYGFDMHARPSDTLLAGGAIDEYVFTTLGLAYRPALRVR